MYLRKRCLEYVHGALVHGLPNLTLYCYLSCLYAALATNAPHINRFDEQ